MPTFQTVTKWTILNLDIKSLILLVTTLIVTRELVTRLPVTRELVTTLIVTRELVTRIIVTRELVTMLIVTRELVATRIFVTRISPTCKAVSNWMILISESTGADPTVIKKASHRM